MKSTSATSRVYRGLHDLRLAAQLGVRVGAERVRALLQGHRPRDGALELDGGLLVQAGAGEVEVVGRAEVAHGDLRLSSLRSGGEGHLHPRTDAGAELLHCRGRGRRSAGVATSTAATAASTATGRGHGRGAEGELPRADVQRAATGIAGRGEHDLDEVARVAVTRRRSKRDGAREGGCAVELTRADRVRDDAGDPEGRPCGEREGGDDLVAGVLHPE